MWLTVQHVINKYEIFDLIGVEIQDFQELKPKPETSEQDLDVGKGQVWDEAHIYHGQLWKVLKILKNTDSQNEKLYSRNCSHTSGEYF